MHTAIKTTATKPIDLRTQLHKQEFTLNLLLYLKLC